MDHDSNSSGHTNNKDLTLLKLIIVLSCTKEGVIQEISRDNFGIATRDIIGSPLLVSSILLAPKRRRPFFPF
jgi:hypothetical protein